jgi:Uma2 family endonuclease
MSVARSPVRYDFDDYVSYTEMHPDGAFELISLYLSRHLDLAAYTPWTEASLRAPGWADGPRADVVVSRGPWLVDGKFAERTTADDIALVVEVSSTSRPKDKKRAVLFAKLGIAEHWLVDLVARRAMCASTFIRELTIETDFLLQLTAT